jgi:hypothetical protein
MPRGSRARRIGREALIVAGFGAFATFTTWPLATNILSGISDATDPYSNAWGLWWIKEQVLSLQDPWFTEEMFAPVGSYLGYHALAPLAGLVMTPITALVGPAVALNLTKLCIPVLAAYVTYRVALRFGLSRSVAVITGGLYGFSPVLVWRGEFHLNLALGSVFFPLCLLCALRYRQERSLKNAALLGASLGAATLIDQTSALFAAVLVVGFLAVVHLRDRVPPKEWWRGLAVATATGIAIASPQLLMMLRQRSADTGLSDVSSLAWSWKSFNTSLHAMAAPSPSLRIDPWDLHETLHTSTAFGEGVTAFGWGVLGLAALALVLVARRPVVIGLFAAFMGAALMALGPELTLSRNAYLPLPVTRYGQELSGLMPYTWLVELSFFEELRVPARFVLLAVLPATLLAGIGLQALIDRGPVARGVAFFLLVLAILESGWPITRDLPQVPLTRDALYEPIREQEGDSIVVDVPLAFADGFKVIGDPLPPEGLLRATEHGHPVATGFVSRLTPNREKALIGHRFYTDIIVQQLPDQPDFGFPPPDPEAGAADAAAMDVGWVVVWPEASSAVRRYIRAVGFRFEHRVEGIELYRAPVGAA